MKFEDYSAASAVYADRRKRLAEPAEKCMWYENHVCTMEECPACADYCPLADHSGMWWRMCKFYDPV